MFHNVKVSISAFLSYLYWPVVLIICTSAYCNIMHLQCAFESYSISADAEEMISIISNY